MAIVYVQTITAWGAAPEPLASGSFTANVSDCILVYGADYTVTSGVTIGFSGTGSYLVLTPPGQFSDVESEPSALGWNSSATAGSQTITVSSTGSGDLVVGRAVEYSGVSTVSAAETSQSKPGTGAGAILGTSVTVPVGSVLVAIAVDLDGGGTVTATSGTTRSSDSASCVTDYAGTGAAIQPAFTGSNGANDHYIVVQWLMTPLATGIIWLWV